MDYSKHANQNTTSSLPNAFVPESYKTAPAGTCCTIPLQLLATHWYKVSVPSISSCVRGVMKLSICFFCSMASFPLSFIQIRHIGCLETLFRQPFWTHTTALPELRTNTKSFTDDADCLRN